MKKLLFFNMLWSLAILNSCCFEKNETHASQQATQEMTIDKTKNTDIDLHADSSSGSTPDSIHIENDSITEMRAIKHGGPDQEIIDSIKREKNKRKKK